MSLPLVNVSSGTRAGFTILELLVTMGILAILFATAATFIRPSIYDLDTATKELVGNLRVSRGHAVSRGAHYRIAVSSASAYGVERLKEAGGAWIVDETEARLVTLPPAIQLATGVGATIEINSRGLLVQPADLLLLTLSDASNGQTRVIEVWPSGQFNER